MFHISKITAGTRVKCYDQDKAGGKTERPSGPGNSDSASLKGLAQDFKDILFKFRRFIKEEHTLMGQENLPGIGCLPAADKPCI